MRISGRLRPCLPRPVLACNHTAIKQRCAACPGVPRLDLCLPCPYQNKPIQYRHVCLACFRLPCPVPVPGESISSSALPYWPHFCYCALVHSVLINTDGLYCAALPCAACIHGISISKGRVCNWRRDTIAQYGLVSRVCLALVSEYRQARASQYSPIPGELRPIVQAIFYTAKEAGKRRINFNGAVMRYKALVRKSAIMIRLYACKPYTGPYRPIKSNVNFGGGRNRPIQRESGQMKITKNPIFGEFFSTISSRFPKKSEKSSCGSFSNRLFRLFKNSRKNPMEIFGKKSTFCSGKTDQQRTASF